MRFFNVGRRQLLFIYVENREQFIQLIPTHSHSSVTYNYAQITLILNVLRFSFEFNHSFVSVFQRVPDQFLQNNSQSIHVAIHNNFDVFLKVHLKRWLIQNGLKLLLDLGNQFSDLEALQIELTNPGLDLCEIFEQLSEVKNLFNAIGNLTELWLQIEFLSKL